MAKLKYICKKMIKFPQKALCKYPGGLNLPSEKINNIIEVSEDEKRVLLRKHNGHLPVFEEIRKREKVEVETTGGNE